MFTSLLAVTLGFEPYRKWYGGSTFLFGRFLSDNKIQNVAVEVGHVPVVPRIVFDIDPKAPLPQMPSGYYSADSKFGRRLLKGGVFSPLLLNIYNPTYSFDWANIQSQLLTKPSGKNWDVNGAYRLSDILQLGERHLKFPNPIFGGIVCYVNLKDVPPAQLEEIAAEMADHDIIKIEGAIKLVPRVGVLRQKIIRTFDEYQAEGDQFYEQIRRVDSQHLKSLSLANWAKLLAADVKSVEVEISKSPEYKMYERVYRNSLDKPGAEEHTTLQMFFSSSRLPEYSVMITNKFGFGHWFRTKSGDRVVRHMH